MKNKNKAKAQDAELNERIAKAQQETIDAYYIKREAQKAEQAQRAAEKEAVCSAVATRPCPDCPYKTYKQTETPVQTESQSRQSEYAPLPVSAYAAPIKAVEPDRVYVHGKIISNK